MNKVKSELSKIDHAVVLVGHSLGGYIISKVAEDRPLQIEKLVFVSAMIPYDDKSVYDVLQSDTQSELLSNLIFSNDKSQATVNEETLRQVVYNGVSAEQIAEAALKLVPQATQPFFAKVTTTQKNFGSVAKAYIECTADKILSLHAQRITQKTISIEQVIGLNTGHVPQIENASILADALLPI